MVDEPSPKPKRDRRAEVARRQAREVAAAEMAASEMNDEKLLKIEFDLQLRILEKQTKNNPTDADGDIDFAYRHMAMPTVTPSMAPSLGGWQWYIYSRTEPIKFLEICAKREDAKAKMAGTITSQRMEDDRRNQFAIIERIEKQLTIDVDAIINDMLDKFPRNVLRLCKKRTEEWDSFIEEECQ